MFMSKVLTSPNQDWVPEHPVERSVIRTYINGLWGFHEYSRWPQPLTDNMWHVACIPVAGRIDLLPEVAWLTLSPHQDWLADDRCSVKGVGFLKRSIRNDLTQCAEQAIHVYDTCFSGPEHQRAYGQELRVVLRNCVDTMNRMPARPAIAIALGAHIQRLSLELVGLQTYLREVFPRILSQGDFSRLLLPVLGLFVHDEDSALRWTRAGIPTWVLQPFTRELRVWKVVSAEFPRFLVENESTPSLEYDPDQLGGVVNTSGGWLSRMVFAISRQLCAATLAPLTEDRHLTSKIIAMAVAPTPSRPERSAVPRRTRRAAMKSRREEVSSDHASTSPSLHASVSATSARGRPSFSNSVQDQLATVIVPRGLPPTGQPFREYTPSPFYSIPSIWSRQLQEVGSLPSPSQSVTYFYPPPFLLDTLSSVAEAPVPPITEHAARRDEKVHQYLHNLVRIRDFCRLRLLDPTISGRPMTISEWRAALWGDYQVRPPPDAERTAAKQRRVEKQYQIKNAVSRLCAQSAALRSYDARELYWFGGVAVSNETAAHDLRVRLALLWESHEVNFRCELVALDTVMVPRTGWPLLHCWAREAQLSGVWGQPSSLVRVVPDTLEEIERLWWVEADDEAWERGERGLRVFVDIMSRWRDFPAGLLALSLKVRWDEHDYKLAQVLAVRFYVRCFIEQYHRLPIPPMIYPSQRLEPSITTDLDSDSDW